MTMRRFWFLRGLKFLVFAVIAVAVLGCVVMSLWNWLLPPLFGWPALGYGQALGLFVLSRLLLGSWRGGHGHGFGWRQRMMERWDKMTPEERERFRAGMRGRCGRGAAAASTAE
jgi:hypothetical protein